MSASWANSTDSTDSAKTLEARAFMSVGVINLVSSALSGTDSILIGEEARVAVTVVGLSIVSRVHWASNTVSVTDKVVSRTFLTNFAHKSETFKTLASTGLNIIEGVLAANVNTLLGS